jgi:antitoxin (DNA-binding transcriptional repressor) of toxin-antitoxin stability system
MKVKSSELKARLPYYLRAVRESGEPVEILLREETVAYLTSAGESASRSRDLEKLDTALKSAGLTLDVDAAPIPNRPWPQPSPQPAPDGRDDVDSVSEMRGERDW